MLRIRRKVRSLAQPPQLAPAPSRLSITDLAQDIAGDLPRDLVLEWSASDQTPAIHERLLAPYLVRGTIVSTDSAGLSSLTQRLPLAAVLKLVSEPKEILYALGRAIGGEAIGVWTADNSQLFFDASIEPAAVVDQLFEAQRRIASRTVQVGVGVHVGACYRLAGGLFGEQADNIEHVAEELTRGGEILSTESTFARMAPHQRALTALCSPPRAAIPLYVTTQFTTGSFVDAEESGADYPAPLSRRFLDTLRSHTVAELAAMPFAEHRRTRSVVFVQSAPRARLRLLDAFTELAVVDALLRRTVERLGGDLVKSNGAIAIALFERDADAVHFALALEEELSANAPDARIAVARGEVFVFDLDRAPAREIAGDPVNIASKLAEDSALTGVLVDRSVSLPALASRYATERYSLSIGAIALEGARLTLR